MTSTAATARLPTATALGTRVHPLLPRSPPTVSRTRPVHPGAPARQQRRRAVQLAGRLLLLRRGAAGRLPSATTPWLRATPRTATPTRTQKAKAWALFGSVDYGLSDSWDLKAGPALLQRREGLLGGAAHSRSSSHPDRAPIVSTSTTTSLSWDLSATYKVNPTVNVYGRVGTELPRPEHPGPDPVLRRLRRTANPATNCVSVADTEDILSVEVGVKSDPGDRQAAPQPDRLLYEVNDQQLTAVGGAVQHRHAAQRRQDRGLRPRDRHPVLTPTANWLMTFGLSYNQTEIQDPNLTVGALRRRLHDPRPDRADGRRCVDGNSLPHRPEWIFNGIIDYRPTRSSNGLFIGTLDWAYYARRASSSTSREEFQDDSFEVGLRLGYAFGDGQVRGRRCSGATSSTRRSPARRHRLQQPDRHDQRSRGSRRRVRRPVLIHIRTHNQGRPSGRPFSLEFNSQRLNDAVSRITAILVKAGQAHPTSDPHIWWVRRVGFSPPL